MADVVDVDIGESAQEFLVFCHGLLPTRKLPQAIKMIYGSLWSPIAKKTA